MEFSERAYVTALIHDLERALPQIWGRKVYTVFIGGGTPSLLSAQAVSDILNAVRALLPLDVHAEITLEANPGASDRERFAGYREAGVNRLSLGIQSFNDAHLKALGRIHDAAEARSAVDAAQQAFDNINLDLMYGLPGQTAEQAGRDVCEALAYQPQHLSCYHLTLEPNTLFHRYPPALPDDETVSDMQQSLEEILAGQGYQHYEISAFAQPNKRSRHNLNYWLFGDYLGIGAGAHSKISFHDRIIRQMRYKQPRAYLEAVERNEPVQIDHEVSRNDLPFEFMMNALRLTEGVPAALFTERTGLPLLLVRHELERAVQRGLLQQDMAHIAPTVLGRRFLNDLLQIFLADKNQIPNAVP